MVTRIRQLLEEKQLTPTQFADLIGVGRPVVSHILSERNKPSLEVVQRVVEAFPEIALPWLLRGTGPMLAEEEAIPTPSAIPAERVNEPAAPKNAAAPTPLAETSSAAPTPVLEAESSNQVAAALPKAALASPPVAPKLVQAARFVPGAAKPPLYVAPVASPKETGEVPTLATAATASPKQAIAPAQPSPEPGAIAASATAAAGLAVPTHLPLPVEPGKSIRRIVIFYRDGSFADYQPEA